MGGICAWAGNGGLPLFVQGEFLRPADCRQSSKRNSCDRRSAVACPSRISANGKMPLSVQVKFLRTADRRNVADVEVVVARFHVVFERALNRDAAVQGGFRCRIRGETASRLHILRFCRCRARTRFRSQVPPPTSPTRRIPRLPQAQATRCSSPLPQARMSRG